MLLIYLSRSVSVKLFEGTFIVPSCNYRLLTEVLLTLIVFDVLGRLGDLDYMSA